MKKTILCITILCCLSVSISSMRIHNVNVTNHSINELLEVQSKISKLDIEELSAISLDETNGTISIGLINFEHLDEIKTAVSDVNTYEIPTYYEIINYYERYAA